MSAGAGAHDETLHCCRRVLAAVHELHKLGYQRLRITPGFSASGMHWRCTIHAVAPGAAEVARYTSGNGRECFGWTDAADDSPRAIAEKIVERFPTLAAAGRGRDWWYAGWYVEMLGHAERGDLPVAYADWYDEPDPRWMPTTAGFQSGLPMPPPAEDGASE